MKTYVSNEMKANCWKYRAMNIAQSRVLKQLHSHRVKQMQEKHIQNDVICIFEIWCAVHTIQPNQRAAMGD